MIRGDAKNFSFKIKNGEEYITEDDFSEIELQFNKQNSINSVTKLKTKEEITFSTDTFTCYLSQQDTFKLKEGENDVQVRLFKELGEEDTCVATIAGSIQVGKVLSKKVLGEENG